jgi:DNA-binding CsgD family transcriptional regulator
LLGRERELDRLRSCLDELGDGRGGIVQLVGEAGIGKTALLAELAADADQRGFVSLRGRAAQLGGEVPFEVFVGALDDYLDSLNPRLFTTLGGEQLAALASVFPSLAELAEEGVEPTASEERYRTHRAIRSLLELLGRNKPLVIAIDDLHWSDGASLELVSHLLRHRPRSPVLLLVASRTGQLPDAVALELDTAEREGTLERIQVEQLADDAADALVAASVGDPEQRRLIVAEGGGNPFYLEQLARNPELARARDHPAGGGEVPDAVALALRTELHGLGDAARQVLDGAAVAGDPFEIELAGVAAELSELAVLGPLEELLARDLVRSTDSAREFRFRHPIVWRAVYEAIPVGRCLAAHSRLAAVLRDSGASPEVRAPHVERAARPGDADAAALLEEAGRAALPRAPASAARWFEAALRLLPEGPAADSGRVSLLLARASALNSIGRLREGRDALRATLALLPPAARRERIQAAVACSVVESFLSLHEEARQVLADELAALGESDLDGRGRLYLAFANLGWQSNDYEEVRGWCRRALEVAGETGVAGVECAARSLLALQAARVGEIDVADELVARAAALTDGLSDEALAEHLQNVLGLFAAELFTEHTAESIRHSERAIRLARATNQAQLLPLMMMGRNWPLTWEGRLDDARSGWEEMLEIALLTGNTEMEAWALAGSTWLAHAAAEPHEALRVAERAEAAASRARGDQARDLPRTYAARLYLDLGDHERARSILLEAGGGPELLKVEPVWRPRDWLYLTRCELARGDRDAAAAYVERARAVADSTGLSARRGWWLVAAALVAEDAGSHEQAAGLGLDAAEAFSGGRLWLDEPEALIIAGRALAASGQPARAKAELQAAYDRALAMGANRRVDQAGQELRKLGVKLAKPSHPGRAGAGRASLSGREREVATLVAEGRTNKEIAAALYISEKMVEKHLSRVFDKLGVRKRGGVGAALARAAQR